MAIVSEMHKFYRNIFFSNLLFLVCMHTIRIVSVHKSMYSNNQSEFDAPTRTMANPISATSNDGLVIIFLFKEEFEEAKL